MKKFVAILAMFMALVIAFPLAAAGGASGPPGAPVFAASSLPTVAVAAPEYGVSAEVLDPISGALKGLTVSVYVLGLVVFIGLAYLLYLGSRSPNLTSGYLSATLSTSRKKNGESATLKTRKKRTAKPSAVPVATSG